MATKKGVRHHKQTRKGPWLVTLANAMRGSDAPMRNRVVGHFPIFFIVFIDHIISMVVTLPLFLRERKQILTFRAKEWGSLIGISLGGSVLGLLCYTQAFATTSNYNIPIIMQKIQPVFTILLAVIILKESLNKRFWLWTVLGLVGAYFVSFGFTYSLGAIPQAELKPVLFAILAALFWGSATVFGKYLTNKYSPQFVTSIRYLSSIIFLVTFMIFLNQWGFFAKLTWQTFMIFVGIAFLPGFIPLLIYYLGLRETKASIATVAELGFPISAIIVNYLFLDATLTLGQIVGTVILLGSITMLSLENAKKN